VKSNTGKAVTRKKRPHRKYPEILASELIAALDALRDLPLDEVEELRERFRRNELPRVAKRPVGPADGLTPRGETITPERLIEIARLEEAWRKFHHYRAGGAGDYASRDVHSWFQQQVATGRRQADAPIIAHLASIGYQNIKRGGKKGARLDTAEKFEVSESHINGVIRRAGLQSKGKTTSAR
jgi:hypothetical protein